MREHEAIVEALRQADGDAAEAAMREHLSLVLDTLRWAIDAQTRRSHWAAG